MLNKSLAISCFIFTALLSLCFANFSFGATLFQDNFNGYTGSPNGHGWGADNTATVVAGAGPDGSNALKINFSADQLNRYCDWNPSTNVQEIYVKYNFKMDCGSGSCIGGAKFLKLFGIRNGDNYANSTFQLVYETATLDQVLYGDSGNTRDAASALRYNPTIDARDGKWHTFEVHMKYNDDGQNNGIYEVWYDNASILKASGINNRSTNNSKYFQAIQLGGWNQYYGGKPYNIYYDNVVISDTRTSSTGSSSSTPSTPSTPSNVAPSAPANLTIVNK